MADDSFDRLRLSLMQDFLPVGLAMLERVKKGGPKKVVELFNLEEDLFKNLKQEGEPAASVFRDQLDQFSPGLGNPVMPVTVSVDVDASNNDQINDEEELISNLTRIENRLKLLEHLLQEESDQDHTS